jgi:diguanylate cyclase (GGDEF)-like protein/PAS domain S-box-containing protein
MNRLVPYMAIFAIVAAVYLVGGLEFVDRSLTDAKFSVIKRPPEPTVVVVAIDPASLLELEVWPWPTRHHAKLLENLLRAGATRVALDVELGAAENELDDAELLATLESAGQRVVLTVSGQRLRGRVYDDDGYAVSVAAPAFSQYASMASVSPVLDSDGCTRRYRGQGKYLGRPLPSLALELSERERRGDDTFYVDYGINAKTIPTLSYADVLQGRFDRGVVQGRTVIVGPTAQELGDELRVPRYGALPGVTVQALALESLERGRDLTRLGSAFTLTLCLALCLMLAALDIEFSWLRDALVAIGVLVGLVLVSVALQAFAPLLIDVAPLMLAIVGGYGYALFQHLDFRSMRPVVQVKPTRETETLMRHVVANSFDAIVTLREDGTVMTFNRVAQKMFGYDEGEALGRNISDLLRLPHAEDRLARGAERRGNRRALYETEGRCKDGRRFPMELAVTWIATESVRRRVMFMRDITERKAQQEALRYQATHDSLTDLPNRNLLQERLEESIAAAREHAWPVAFLLLDLDRFKEINDTLGHHIGDLLLRKIARRLESSVRESDTIARLGGDEFAVLMPATGLESAQQAARKLVNALEEPFQVEGLSLQVETSVGITLFPEHGNAPAALIRRADVAMYAAKKERSGVMVYDPEQDFTSIRLLALTGDLRRAIHDNGLSMHFQPKISARNGRPIGVEALSRWRHPSHGDIPPDEFIGLAEHSGLIQPLTQWVLETALRQCAVWKREGINLSMSVNLSARNLLDEQLPATLLSMLKSSKMPVDKLTLEITESVIMDDPQRALEVLTELHNLGVKISIDDFGTGYSSLGYLKKLPATEIKIDKSFVLEMDRNPDDRMIVHSTIELAHNLDLSVVAEGVSSRQTWEELKRLGCDTGQGYYFSRPLPADRLAQWYREAMAEAERAMATEAG